jgi:hypothetical protein
VPQLDHKCILNQHSLVGGGGRPGQQQGQGVDLWRNKNIVAE